MRLFNTSLLRAPSCQRGWAEWACSHLARCCGSLHASMFQPCYWQTRRWMLTLRRVWVKRAWAETLNGSVLQKRDELRLSWLSSRWRPTVLWSHSLCVALWMANEHANVTMFTADLLSFDRRGLLMVAYRWKIVNARCLQSFKLYADTADGILVPASWISSEKQARLFCRKTSQVFLFFNLELIKMYKRTSCTCLQRLWPPATSVCAAAVELQSWVQINGGSQQADRQPATSFSGQLCNVKKKDKKERRAHVETNPSGAAFHLPLNIHQNKLCCRSHLASCKTLTAVCVFAQPQNLKEKYRLNNYIVPSLNKLQQLWVHLSPVCPTAGVSSHLVAVWLFFIIYMRHGNVTLFSGEATSAPFFLGSLQSVKLTFFSAHALMINTYH